MKGAQQQLNAHSIKKSIIPWRLDLFHSNTDVNFHNLLSDRESATHCYLTAQPSTKFSSPQYQVTRALSQYIVLHQCSEGVGVVLELVSLSVGEAEPVELSDEGFILLYHEAMSTSAAW